MSFVQIDLDDFETAYQIISDAIESNLYEPITLQKNEEHLLNEINSFHVLNKSLTDLNLKHSVLT